MIKTILKIIKENNFKQGTCLLVENDSKIKTKENSPLKEGLYVVTTQDCDIINPDLEKEPYIDLISVQKISAHDGSYTQGKNPRRLQLTTNKHTNHHLEFTIHEHYKVSKENLKFLKPHDNIVIEGKNLQILVDWIKKRHSRTAFPNEFNIRVGKSLKKLEKILTSDAKDTEGLFIRLNTLDELPTDQSYKLTIKMLADPEYYKNNNTASDGLEKIVDILSKIQGIEIINYQFVSTEEISVYELKKLSQWDFDYISFKD